jgi:cysteine desulfurase
MGTPVYLDHNATTRVRPQAIEAMTRALSAVGNPSSIHAAGRAARASLEAAREAVAALIGVKAGSITFVSGGTEASNLAVESAVAAGYARIIIGATEHEAVVESAKASGLPVEVWPVDGAGLADLAWLEQRLATGGRTLVCLMLANNETGVIQPVAQASALVRAADGWLHVDAVQAAGKIAVDFNALGADTMALSAHKLGGPQGVGALAAGPRALLTRSLHGGGQERGRRSGTENVPGLAGFGAAAKAAAQGLAGMAAQAPWRDAAAARLAVTGAVALGEGAPRLPQTLCLSLKDFPSDLQVMNLDLAGVMISAGAACSSGKVKASHVVESMGRPDLAPFVIRVSGGWDSTELDWRRFGDVWLEAHARHTARRREVA